MEQNRKYINISVIVPTYNEKDNISILFDRIDNSLKSKNINGITYEIVVVDDDSDDGTDQIVKNLAGRYPVKLIERKNDKGLASAVVEGFKNAKGNIFVVMDADLQHPPEKIKDLVNEICLGSDIVVASRHNGEFGKFNIVRKTMSNSANFIAKILFPKIANIGDIQSGYFALRKDVIGGAVLNPTGYKILLEILILGKYNVVKEIGYKFASREHGESKLGVKTIMEYIYHLISLSFRTKDIYKLIKYSIVGISGIAVNTLVLYIFTSVLGIFYLLSSAISYEVSILSNFLINDRWTFKSVNNKSKFLTRAIYFNYTMIAGAIFGIILLYIFTDLLRINYLISNIISIFIVFIFRFYTSITVVWKH